MNDSEPVLFVIRDNQCPFCTDKFHHGNLVTYTHEGLCIEVQVCSHASRPADVADAIIVEHYGDLRISRDFGDGFRKAIARGRANRWSRPCYWQHLLEEIDVCATCGKCGAYPIHRELLGISEAAVLSIGSMFCFGCKKVAVEKMKAFDQEAFWLWLKQAERQREAKREGLRSLRKVRSLLAQSRRALRENKGHDVLQSLKAEFELEVNSQP